MERVSPQHNFEKMGKSKYNVKGAIVDSKENHCSSPKKKHSCLLLHIVGLILILIKLYLSKHLSYLGRSSATRELGKQYFMTTYRASPSLRDLLIRAKIPQPPPPSQKGCKRPHTCKYCCKISQSRHIKNLQSNKTWNTLRKSTCQSNHLLYCLECNWCHVKYEDQTRNRIFDRFWDDMFDLSTQIIPQWEDIFWAKMINWILRWLYTSWNI